MNAAPSPRPLRRRWPRLVALAAIFLLAMLLMLALFGERLLLFAAGKALDLDLHAQGIDYRLRGTPQLELRGLEAGRPGDAPMLRARRAFLALPWRTLRTLGDDLTMQRIELDAPVLDLPALQRWLAARPPSGATRIPTLTHGLRLHDGRIDNDDWRIDGLAIDMPALHPQRLLRMHVRGRYRAGPLSIPADLAIAIAHPQRLLDGASSGVAGVGRLTFADAGWQVPAQVFLAGPLRLGKDSALLQPAKLGVSARYLAGTTQLPFRLGLHGPMAFNNASWRFVPATVVLDGDRLIPDARARGSLSIGKRLRLHLDGALAGWPDDWPALPAPLSASSAPLPFALDYAGALAFSDPASLTLRRDATSFTARFRLPTVSAWLDAGNSGSPLPPLAGTLSTPRLELDGATLEGVEMEFDDAP